LKQHSVGHRAKKKKVFTREERVVHTHIGCSFNTLVALPMEIFCFCEGMSSFEFPVSKIRVELSILTFAFRQVYCLLVFTLEQKTF
jgi:hypothetical protein